MGSSWRRDHGHVPRALSPRQGQEEAMIATATAIEAVPALGHDEAMRLAETEYERLLAVVDDLRGDQWSRQTDCPDWDVKDMIGHLLGMLEALSDAKERMRQVKTAAEIA